MNLMEKPITANITLNSIEQVNDLCNLCDRYKSKFDVDISCGRYSVDGNSVLGVLQLFGRTVTVMPLVCEDDDMESVREFIEGVKMLEDYEY